MFYADTMKLKAKTKKLKPFLYLYTLPNNSQENNNKSNGHR